MTVMVHTSTIERSLGTRLSYNHARGQLRASFVADQDAFAFCDRVSAQKAFACERAVIVCTQHSSTLRTSCRDRARKRAWSADEFPIWRPRSRARRRWPMLSSVLSTSVLRHQDPDDGSLTNRKNRPVSSLQYEAP